MLPLSTKRVQPKKTGIRFHLSENLSFISENRKAWLPGDQAIQSRDLSTIASLSGKSV